MTKFRTMRCMALVLAFSSALAAEGQHAPSEEAVSAIVGAVEESVSEIVPGPLLQTAKATYLEGYGLIVTVGVALEPPRNPFSRTKPPAEVRRSSERRGAELKETAVELLAEYVSGLAGLGADERVAIVVYMLNTNPADLPDLPTQFVVSVKKQDAVDLRAETISDAVFAERVTVREY